VALALEKFKFGPYFVRVSCGPEILARCSETPPIGLQPRADQIGWRRRGAGQCTVRITYHEHHEMCRDAEFHVWFLDGEMPIAMKSLSLSFIVYHFMPVMQHIFRSQFSIAFEGKKVASLFIPISLVLDLLKLKGFSLLYDCTYVLPQYWSSTSS